MNQELKKLIKEYLAQYPDQLNPLEHVSTLSIDKLTKILRERKGRKIKFYYVKGFDTVFWLYT